MFRFLAVLLGSLICGAGTTTVVAQDRPDWAAWSASPHHSSRGEAKVSAVIVHYTAGGALESTIGWFRNPEAKVSSHYVVGRGGEIVQMVDLDRAAWHAGKSVLDGRDGVNAFSVGIEVCNWGTLTKNGDEFFTYTGSRYRGETPFQDADGRYWEPFTDAQYAAIAKICDDSIERLKITHITGHSDVAVPVGRKIDPGSALDWQRLRKQLSQPYTGHFGSISR